MPKKTAEGGAQTGRLTGRALSMAFEWLAVHRSELVEQLAEGAKPPTLERD